MTNPTSPGWYDDPESPDQLRYFDGIIWSRHTTPRAPTVSPSPPAAHPGPPASGGWPGQAGHGHQWPGSGSQGHDPSRWGGVGQAGPGGAGHPAMRPVGPTTLDGTPLASYGQRVGAFFLDLLIKVVVNGILAGYPFYLAFRSYIDEAMDAARTGRSTPMTVDLSQVQYGWLAAYVIIVAVVGLVYNVAFNVRRGATPGKSVVGISVRKVDRPGPLDVATAGRRAAIPFLAIVLSFVPLVSTMALCLWVADLAVPLAQQRRQALHDLVAGTQVVRGPQPPRR